MKRHPIRRSSFGDFSSRLCCIPFRSRLQPRGRKPQKSCSGGARAETKLRAGRTILTRLLDFGLPVPEAAIEPSKAVFKRELVIDNEATSIVDGDSTKIGMSRIARRIEREIPAAKGVFVGEVKDGGICRPDDGSGNRQDQVYEKFDRAFRFQSGKRTIWVTHFLCREGSGAFGYPSYMLFDSASSSPWFLHRATEKEDRAPADACSSTVSICTTDAQIAGDRFLILSSKESRAVEIFDLTTRKRIFRKYALSRGDLLAKVLLSDDARIAMQINTDDSFAIFRCACLQGRCRKLRGGRGCNGAADRFHQGDFRSGVPN